MKVHLGGKQFQTTEKQDGLEWLNNEDNIFYAAGISKPLEQLNNILRKNGKICRKEVTVW
jgi:hypothetical protein